MDFVSTLQWNHVSGNNAASLSLFIFDNQRAFTVEAPRPPDQGSSADVDPNPAPAQTKMCFPTRAHRFKAVLTKVSIASVQVLNQSR
jgi:hypothetical protein